MLSTIRHIYRKRLHAKRDKGLAKRSSQWPALERKFLGGHASCAACAGTQELQVHHVKPFHSYPEDELDPANLITLCMMKDRHCHLLIGHAGSFHKANPNVRLDAADALTAYAAQNQAGVEVIWLRARIARA